MGDKNKYTRPPKAERGFSLSHASSLAQTHGDEIIKVLRVLDTSSHNMSATGVAHNVGVKLEYKLF